MEGRYYKKIRQSAPSSDPKAEARRAAGEDAQMRKFFAAFGPSKLPALDLTPKFVQHREEGVTFTETHVLSVFNQVKKLLEARGAAAHLPAAEWQGIHQVVSEFNRFGVTSCYAQRWIAETPERGRTVLSLKGKPLLLDSDGILRINNEEESGTYFRIPIVAPNIAAFDLILLAIEPTEAEIPQSLSAAICKSEGLTKVLAATKRSLLRAGRRPPGQKSRAE